MKVIVYLEHDDYDPLEDCDCMWKLYSFGRRHSNFKHPSDLGMGPLDEHGEPKIEDSELKEKLDNGLAHIVSCYQHGGIQWGLRGEVWQCPWDTSRIAGLLVWEHKPEDLGVETYEERCRDARGYLEAYTAVCNGEVYCYSVVDEENGNGLDSCGGFIGTKESVDNMMAQIQEGLPAGAEIEVRGDAAGLADGYNLTKPIAEKETVSRKGIVRDKNGNIVPASDLGADDREAEREIERRADRAQRGGD